MLHKEKQLILPFEVLERPNVEHFCFTLSKERLNNYVSSFQWTFCGSTTVLIFVSKLLVQADFVLFFEGLVAIYVTVWKMGEVLLSTEHFWSFNAKMHKHWRSWKKTDYGCKAFRFQIFLESIFMRRGWACASSSDTFSSAATVKKET